MHQNADRPSDPVDVLTRATGALSDARPDVAAALLQAHYPMRPPPRRPEHRARGADRVPPASPRAPTTPARRLALFLRDGFIDRRDGRRLVYPSVLYALAHEVPAALPIGGANGGAPAHQAHRELFPTLEHVVGPGVVGTLAPTCWVTVAAEAVVCAAEAPAGPSSAAPVAADAASEPFAERAGRFAWDGLLGWYLDYARTRPYLMGISGNAGWHAAAMGAAATRARAA